MIFQLFRSIIAMNTNPDVFKLDKCNNHISTRIRNDQSLSTHLSVKGQNCFQRRKSQEQLQGHMLTYNDRKWSEQKQQLYMKRSQTAPQVVRSSHLANNEQHRVSGPHARTRLCSENLHGSNGQSPMSRAFRKERERKKRGTPKCHPVARHFIRCPPDL